MSTPDLDLTLEALAHLLCGERDPEPNPSRASARYHAVAGQYFDGFEVMDAGDPDDIILIGKNAADMPIWPVDVSTGHMASLGGWEPGTWHFERIQTLKPQEWRNKLRLYSGRMLEEAVLISEPSGRQITYRRPYAVFGDRVQAAGTWVNGFSFTGLGNWQKDPAQFSGEREHPEDAARFTDLVNITAGMSLRRHYLWSVLIGEGTGPRARFVTDPVGVREAFRLRDIPPGKKRRAALLHWVKSHWRKSRGLSAEDRAWVRAHLRGVWSYEWNGLRCQIEPSAEDLATLSAYKAGAA